MLDRLPPELLDLVLQLAAPPSTILDDWYGADHRATLRACALVCRRVSGVAQGLLWKDFALVGTDDVAKVWLALLKEGNRRRAMGTRTVLVGGPTDFEGLEALLPQFGGLVELRIDGGHSLKELSVAALAGLPNLRTLDVCDLTLNGDWANVCYPSLVRLHLDTVYFYTDAPASPTFFRQDAFPSLRALQLRDLGVDDGENYTRGFPTLPLPFLAQLDMLSLSALDLDVLPPSIFSSATPVVLESLSALVRLCSLPSRLSSLHLPSSLRDILPDATTFHQLEQACKQHGVEFLWCDGGDDDIFFHFWRYASKLGVARLLSSV